MPRPIRRSFTILDAMIFIAAIAPAILVVRAWCEDWDYSITALLDRQRAFEYGVPYLPLSLPFLTLALIVIRVRPPRPPLRLVLRQAGFQASLAVGIAAIIWLLRDIRQILQHTDPTSWTGLIATYVQEDFPPIAGFSVASAWLFAGLVSRRRPEKSWVDRAGRAVGWLWIATAAVALIRGQADFVLGP